MSSPFPGMNPFLEHSDVWSTFHLLMIGAMAQRLSAQVRPDYLVHAEAHLWIHVRVDDDEDRGSSRRLIGRSAAYISKIGASTKGGLVSSEVERAVLTPATRILIPMVDIERQRYLEIRDKRSRELVTVVELLSPVNKKSGPDRTQYLTKRSEILASPAHFVEIDLLRCGRAMPDLRAPFQHLRGHGRSLRGSAGSRVLADRAATALAHHSSAAPAGHFLCLARAPRVAAPGVRRDNVRPGNLRTGGRAPARSSRS